MKTFRAKTGPILHRPYYDDHEIESTCDDELKKVGLMPATPSPVRIDRFVEKKFGITHSYDDLATGILGYTRFGSKGVEAIVVERSLEDGSDVSKRRLRSTLAHEAGHGLFHTHLFLLPGANHRQLFSDSAHDHTPRVLCRGIVGSENGGSRGYQGEWWEFHANRAIGALLLPRQLLEAALKVFMKDVGGIIGGFELPLSAREDAIKAVAQIFDVNPPVARYRIGQFYPVSASMQGRL